MRIGSRSRRIPIASEQPQRVKEFSLCGLPESGADRANRTTNPSRLARVRTDGVDPAHFIAVSEQTWCCPVASENAANPRNRLPDHFIPNPIARRNSQKCLYVLSQHAFTSGHGCAYLPQRKHVHVGVNLRSQEGTVAEHPSDILQGYSLPQHSAGNRVTEDRSGPSFRAVDTDAAHRTRNDC
jgi:hypothetical protein